MSGAGTLPAGGGYPGQAGLQDFGNLFNALDFLVRMVLADDVQAEIVRVQAVHGGGVNAPATVDVLPLVNQVDGAGNQTPHGIVYGLACCRIQGGNGSVIMDPVAGDIGLVVYCDRDISTVKATKGVSPPGSWRQRSRSDGVYVLTLLGGMPTQYVQVTQSGVNVVSTGTISLTVGGFGIQITSSGTTIDGKPFLPHEHGGVQTGGGSTGPVA